MEDKDTFEEFIKKWTWRIERLASFLAWIMHLFLIVCVSVWLLYCHLAQIRDTLPKGHVIAESRSQIGESFT